MGFFSHSRIACAVALAGAFLAVAPANALDPAAAISLGAEVRAAAAAEPFALPASPIIGGPTWDKWSALEHKLADERVQLALCDGDRERCASEAALKLLTIVDLGRSREGRARLGEINRAVNLAIRAMSDLAQYGEMDVWSSPLATFYRGAGDCEDYAIAKFTALRLAGVPAGDLRIIIMRDLFHGEDHAVAAARLDGNWLMLDNRRMAMVEDADVRNYRPLFVMDDSGLRKYADMPLVASVSARGTAPSTIGVMDLQRSPSSVSN